MDMSTYIIKRPEVEEVFDMKDYISTIEKAFRLYGEGKAQMPSKVYLTFDKGDLRCMPAYLPSMKAAGVKNVNVHAGNKDLPAVMATITLIDPDTGFPIAIMDGTHITKMRTGAAGAVAARYLSREDSKVAGFVGAGVQAETQLEALLIVRPELARIIAYDINEANMKNFARDTKNRYGLDVEWAGSVEEAVKNADIVITTTPVRRPIVKAEYVRPGTHINAIGADAPDKQELDTKILKQPIVKAEYVRPGTHINAIGADAPDKQELDTKILKQARIVIDNWEQASHGGEINVALAKKLVSREDIYAELGEIVTGKKRGRESSEQIIIFDSTGLAIQDVSAASEIYRKLMSDKSVAAKLEKIELV
jgi:alanine dehydrogenase